MGSGSGSGSGSGDQGISGTISANATWMGDVLISGNTTIAPGVTVTIAAGSHLKIKDGSLINVQGILDAQGTSAGKITFDPVTTSYGGISVPAGGELRLSYTTLTTGNISISGGTANIIDSRMSHASGDYLIMSGGTIVVKYSAIGVESPATDTTHCDMHFGGTGNVITFVHSNVSSSAYGLMFYGGMAAKFTYDNWFNNTTDVDTQIATPVSGDFSNGWFQGPTPTGAGLTTTPLAPARLTACDGTNDTICAGPRP